MKTHTIHDIAENRLRFIRVLMDERDALKAENKRLREAIAQATSLLKATSNEEEE